MIENKCKIVLLPSHKDSNLFFHCPIGSDKSLHYMSQGKIHREEMLKAGINKPQHLYILSDDEIKEGDWYFSGNRFTNDNLSKFKVGISSTEFYKEQSIKKIIATTNPDLIKEGIPSIDGKFIKEYCNKPVDEVNVVYDKHSVKEFIDSLFQIPTPIMKGKLRLSPNGSIVIKPIEETWDDIYNEYLRTNHEDNTSDYVISWLMKLYKAPKRIK